MKVSLVAGLPMPLLAVHLYPPPSCLLMVKGKVTTLLSASLVQVIVGSGSPLALQVRATLVSLFTDLLLEM